MKLYKFRELSSIERVFDIVENRRMHCSEYKNLNDPFEGYATHVSGGLRFPIVFPAKFEGLSFKVKKLDEIYEKERLRVCSFSASYHDVKLWSFYSNSHQGICIEFEVPDDLVRFEDGDELNRFYQMKYENSIGDIEIDDLNREAAFRVLRRKLQAWAYETEFRLITDQEKFVLPGPVTRILTGLRISDSSKEILRRLFPSTTVVETELDDQKCEVRIK